MNCDNCDQPIEKMTTQFTDRKMWTHTDSSKWCARQFHDTAIATPIVRKRYTVIFNDGLPGRGPMGPEAPCNANQASTIDAARDMFRTWLRVSGNDYYRAPGYEQPQAELIETEKWDGISYGDYPWTCVLIRGIRGGIRTENV